MNLDTAPVAELSLLNAGDLRSILSRKGHSVWTITPEATVFEALATMNEKRIGALVVVSSGQLVGVISERDYARKVILKGKSSKHTPVEEIMSSPVITAAADRPVGECLRMMIERRIRHLPVVQSGELEGIVSIGDLVNAVLEAQASEVRELRNYVAGSYPR
jgi:CBS domain-containing protein